LNFCLDEMATVWHPDADIRYPFGYEL